MRRLLLHHALRELINQQKQPPQESEGEDGVIALEPPKKEAISQILRTILRRPTQLPACCSWLNPSLQTSTMPPPSVCVEPPPTQQPSSVVSLCHPYQHALEYLTCMVFTYLGRQWANSMEGFVLSSTPDAMVPTEHPEICGKDRVS